MRKDVIVRQLFQADKKQQNVITTSDALGDAVEETIAALADGDKPFFSNSTAMPSTVPSKPGRT